MKDLKHKRPRYQTLDFTLANGSVAGVEQIQKIFLDNKYETATAFALIRIAGTNPVNVGVRNQSDQIVDPVCSKILEVESDTPVQGRFIPCNIPARGMEVTVQFSALGINATMDNKFQLVFKLED